MASAAPEIDKVALKAKYAEERDKRLRDDASEQYIRLESEFEDLATDPYLPVQERAPVTDHVTFAFVYHAFEPEASLTTPDGTLSQGWRR